METINWIGRISCLQGNVSLLTEGERLGIIHDISLGKVDGVTTLGTLWNVQIEFEPKCSLSDLDKASRKLLAKTIVSGRTSGTITIQNVISNKIGNDHTDLCATENGIQNNSGNQAKTIPVRVSKDTFNNMMGTLSALCEEVKYAERAKTMIASIADNAKCSNITSLCVCQFTLEEISELIALLSCSTVCPEMDFFQLIMDKQDALNR